MYQPDALDVGTALNVKNPGGTTLVTNAGSNGKFLGVMDFDVRGGKVADFRYRLLPVFSNQLPADPAMQALIDRVRAPYEAKLAETLAVTDGLLYRRGNFNGSWDQLICDALMEVQGAQIAFSPGFRWGTSILPGEPVTMEHLLDETAITYPYTTVSMLTGETIKTILEDVADNLFNPDPYYQQGGDMVRVGGLSYAIDPNAKIGGRITRMSLAGTPFVIPTENLPWKRQARPRLAGVSSFGMSGTNAHVLLQEAPARETTEVAETIASMSLPSHSAPPSTVSAKEPHATRRDVIDPADEPFVSFSQGHLPLW